MDIRKLVPEERTEEIHPIGSRLRTLGLILTGLSTLSILGIYLGTILTGNLGPFIIDIENNKQILLSTLLAIMALLGILLFVSAPKAKRQKLINGQLIFNILCADANNFYIAKDGGQHVAIPRTRINDYERTPELENPQIIICGKLTNPILTLRAPTPPED